MDPTLLVGIIGVGGTLLGAAVGAFLSYFVTKKMKQREGKQALECLRFVTADFVTNFENAARFANRHSYDVSTIEGKIPDNYIEVVALYNPEKASILLRISSLLAAYQNASKHITGVRKENSPQWEEWWKRVMAQYAKLKGLIEELQQ